MDQAERDRLLRELARIYTTSAVANLVLDKAFHDYGRERRPNIDATRPDAGWNQILKDFDDGAVKEPYPRLLAAVLDEHPGNPVFRELAEKYCADPARISDDERASPSPTPPPTLPARRRLRSYAFGATGMIAVASLIAAAILISTRGGSSAATAASAAGNNAGAPASGTTAPATSHPPMPAPVPFLPAGTETDTPRREPDAIVTTTNPGPASQPTASPPAPVTTPQLFGPSHAGFGQSFSLTGTGWRPCEEGTQINFRVDGVLISQAANLNARGAFDHLITVRTDGGIGRYNSSDYIYLTPGQYEIEATTISGQNCTQEKPTITLTIT